MAKFEEASGPLRAGPGDPCTVDIYLRQAIMWCWMALPEEQKTPEMVEREIRRMVERALRDMKDDMQAFGTASGPPR